MLQQKCCTCQQSIVKNSFQKKKKAYSGVKGSNFTEIIDKAHKILQKENS